MSVRMKYKVDESKCLEGQCILIEFGAIEAQLDDLIRRSKKILPRRCQRYERAADSLSLKLFRLAELYKGLILTGELPDQQNHNGCPDWG